MSSKTKPTETHTPDSNLWGRGVTAALPTFKPTGEGSTPFGPTRPDRSGSMAARSSAVRAGLL